MTALPPVGVCTKCGEFIYDAARINGNCGRRSGGKRCRGVYGSTLSKHDWATCGSCNGSGRGFWRNMLSLPSERVALRPKVKLQRIPVDLIHLVVMRGLDRRD